MLRRIGTFERHIAALAIASLFAMAAPLLPALSSIAQVADPIVLQAQPLVGGRFAQGGWLAVSVSLRNDGPPVSGRIVATGSDGQVRRAVDLPAGARKEVTLYVRPASYLRSLTVELQDNDGKRLASGEAKISVLESGLTQVAVVGDASGGLRTQLVGRSADLPQPVATSAADLPERPEPLSGFGAIVWAGDSSTLTDAQVRALDRWVAGGGTLVVLGGPDWQARTAAFRNLLPVTDLASLDRAPLASLASLSGGQTIPSGATATIASGTLRDGAIALARLADGGAPVVAATSHGAGRVAFVAADLAADPLRSWDGASLLLSRLIPDNRATLQFGGGAPFQNDVASQIAGALTNIPALEVPPAELLLVVIVGYILLIGPISYIVLRRRDRRDLAWVTAPLLVVVFSAGTYGIGWTLKGSQVIVNEIAIVRTTTDGGAASVQTYAGVFSPSRSSYDLTVHADALLSAVQNQGFGVRDTANAPYVVEQGDPAHLRGLAVSVFGLQAMQADSIVPYQPDLDVDWHLDGSALAGTVRNRSDHTVEDVAVISQGSGVMVGTLQAGEQRDFRLNAAQFGGMPASEQVYGSSGFDQSSPAQRLVAVRRQVLDSLLGYGSKFPIPAMAGPTGAGQSGPMVVGWRNEVTPVAVDVDGLSPQHYRQAVEVVSGRPTLGSGAVTLGSGSLAVDVVSTSGDAAEQPGGVMLSNGEAVFRISLPLEASGLRPSAMTLLAGQDPSVIFAGGVAGGLPPGLRFAVLRSQSDTWEDLGAIGATGQVSVSDPAAAISASGQVMVRLTAQGGGGAPVFVGATIQGVLP
jgi:hypothetical protein